MGMPSLLPAQPTSMGDSQTARKKARLGNNTMTIDVQGHMQLHRYFDGKLQEQSLMCLDKRPPFN
jgi:hypothetical protein